MDYSVVVPVYNEQENISILYRRLSEVLKSLTKSYEIIFVNDGSLDKSIEIIKELSSRNCEVKFLDFSRNFGHQIAITAGMDFSQGRAIIIIDCDLQDPPELIPKMIEEWEKGYEVVYAVRRKRKGETFFKKFTAFLFYRIFSKLTNINMPLNAGDFRLIDRKILDTLRTIRERHRFMRGLISWVGYRQSGVFYDREKRVAGKTKYPFLKMLRFSIDGITSFSVLPLKIATILGFVISGFAFLVGLYFIWLKISMDEIIQGWMTLANSILFLGGVQLIILGILGEYIGRIYDEVKQRPLYIVREAKGFDENI